MTYLYGAVRSSEESFVSRCCHRQGPLDKSLCDASLPPTDKDVDTVLLFCKTMNDREKANEVQELPAQEWLKPFYSLQDRTLAAERCWVWGYRSQRHWMLSQQILTNQTILQKKREITITMSVYQEERSIWPMPPVFPQRAKMCFILTSTQQTIPGVCAMHLHPKVIKLTI